MAISLNNDALDKNKKGALGALFISNESKNLETNSK
jgi:hypothetical protein